MSRAIISWIKDQATRIHTVGRSGAASHTYNQFSDIRNEVINRDKTDNLKLILDKKANDNIGSILGIMHI